VGRTPTRRPPHAAVWGAMFNAGQTCCGHQWSGFCYAMESVTTGSSTPWCAMCRAQMGAAEGYVLRTHRIDDSQVARYRQVCQTTTCGRARSVTGGKAPGTGHGKLYPPTVLVDVDHSIDLH